MWKHSFNPKSYFRKLVRKMFGKLTGGIFLDSKRSTVWIVFFPWSLVLSVIAKKNMAITPWQKMHFFKQKITALLRYNSRTTNFTHLKYASLWFLVYSRFVQTSLLSNFKTFHHLKKEPCTHLDHLHPSFAQNLTTTNLLLFLCLFWTFYISGIVTGFLYFAQNFQGLSVL